MARPKEITDEQIVVAARRRFLTDGSAVSAVEIARDLGVSHTTLFNRFGSKEALLLAALAPSPDIPWVAALEAGPDRRSVREQLVEHAVVMSAYFQELQARIAVLQAAGVALGSITHEGEAPPARAFRVLTEWLQRAQREGRIAECDVDVLASTILGVLHNRAFTACVCGHAEPDDGEMHVRKLVDLLWRGIAVDGQ